jgi:hypothetical protein
MRDGAQHPSRHSTGSARFGRARRYFWAARSSSSRWPRRIEHQSLWLATGMPHSTQTRVRCTGSFDFPPKIFFRNDTGPPYAPEIGRFDQATGRAGDSPLKFDTLDGRILFGGWSGFRQNEQIRRLVGVHFDGAKVLVGRRLVDVDRRAGGEHIEQAAVR